MGQVLQGKSRLQLVDLTEPQVKTVPMSSVERSKNVISRVRASGLPRPPGAGHLLYGHRKQPTVGMRALLTGGAGYIGSHIARELLAAGHEVTLLDDFSTALPTATDKIAILSGGYEPSVIRMDIRDTAACTRLIADLRPDVVIHLAGLKDVAYSMQAPDLYHDINVGGTASLLTAMQRSGCHRLIFSSSAAVYGDPDFLPIDEAHPCKPSSPYGCSKLAAEQLIRDWTGVDTGNCAIILRYFNPVGCFADAHRGMALSGGGDALMNRLVAVADGAEPYLAIFGGDYDTPDGTCLRDYIHVADVAEAHVAALPVELPGAQTINIGTGRTVSVLQLARLFQTYTGRAVPVVISSPRPGDAAASCAAVGYAGETLGWSARRSLGEMCRSAWVAHSSLQKRTGTENSTAMYMPSEAEVPRSSK